MRLLLAVLIAAAPPVPARAANPSAATRGVTDPALAALVAAHAALADAQDPERSATWPDVTPAATAARDTALARLAAGLAVPSATPPGEQDALTRRLLARQIATDREIIRLDEARAPFIKSDGFYTQPTYAAGNTVLASADDTVAWTRRLEALPAFYAAHTANMRRGIATGHTQPAPVVDSVTDMLARMVALPPADDPLVKPFARVPASVDPARWSAARAAAERTVAERVRPAQRALLAFFQTEYRPRARPGLGATTLPNGPAFYAAQVRRHTTTSLTPDQIFALGAAEVARIRAAMTVAIAENGFKGTIPQFLAHVRADRRFYAPTTTAYVERASEIAKRADYALPRLFGTLPRLTYGVVVKPPEIQGSSNGYLNGDPEKGVAGQVSVNQGGERDPLFALPAWVVHEGVPGHHLQIARAQELPLPRFRRDAPLTAYTEGWGLYSETLGEEMGIYRDAYERFGRLSFEIWRACRLMMDVGLHARGWSFDQAADCLRQNTALPEVFIRDETLRYVAWPGQALAYKVGELELLRLRRRAETALGPRFDVRAYHDLILGSGPLPLAILAERVDAWIARGGR